MIRIEFEWNDAPDEGDRLESRTMARLMLSIGDQVLTRVLDRSTRSQREGIVIPLHPLAQWLVTQWWSLFYEPWPFLPNIPGPGRSADPAVRAWLHRHCLRTAVPGFASPYVCIFSQGRDVALVGRSDAGDRYQATPVKFLHDIDVSLDRDELRGALTRVVEAVLTRLEGMDEPRVAALRADWLAICSASAPEAEFCRAAGRLGLDPLDVPSWPPNVASWFERTPDGELDGALAMDLLETPDPPTIKPAQHAMFERMVQQFGIQSAMPACGPQFDHAAFHDGYRFAEWIRRALAVADDDSLGDLRDASKVACDRAFVLESASIPEGGSLALTGWRAHSVPVIAARPTGSLQTRRFLWARALYLALRGSARGPRLVTDSRTWDQRASRAFGAELLAPRVGVVAQFEAAAQRFGRDEALSQVAEHYNVSAMVIRHQLDNAA